jgi:hypothetical protein
MAKKKTTKVDTATLSGQLRQIIADCGLTRYRVCKLAGVDQGQMHRFVTTGKGISLETLDRIGQALRLRLVVDDDADGKNR